MSDLKPDPDALLAALNRDDARSRRGRLKVFLGMCPGVGKTYAMLRAAQEARADKTDVLVGIVETHGRAETEALLSGLALLPRRTLTHRGATLTELDLEALLTRRPALAVIDELAHTNAPGSRHTKRWQDVLELLEAGINVFTTLNIQHVESRADAVRQITGAPQLETVPDSLLDLADEVELIDLTPEALRERLSDGKVYLGSDRTEAARDNFFRETHLTALRELALRFTAERVDRQLRQLRAGLPKQTVWRSGERLLVAVGPSPFSTQLVRWTRRLAAAQGAPWLAVYVEPSEPLSPAAQQLLDKNLSLARELGAEVVLTHDDNIPAALVRAALQHNATQIVVGKPRGNRFLDTLRGGTLVDKLLRQGGNIDIYVVPADPDARLRPDWRSLDPALHSPPREYALAAGVIAAFTLLGQLLPADTYLAVGLVYLLAVIALSLRVGRWPVLLAGILSALTWNFLFIPPRFTFAINKIEDAALFFTYFAVAIIAGQLTARIRAQARNERLREERSTALFQLTRALAAASTLDDAVFAALRQADELFSAKTSLLLVDESSETLTPHFAASFSLDEKERSVADWAFRHRRPAGRFTDTLPGSAAFHLPLVRDDRALGVLLVAVPEAQLLTLAQRDLLDAFARQLALIVERDHLRAASEREKLLAASDKLHRTLLDSVSHELRTPLAVITGSLENLADTTDEKLRTALIAESRSAAQRLNRLVGNLLDQTRLESGALKPRLDWCDARDLANAAREAVGDALNGHPFTIEIPDDLPPLRADFALTEQALANLLLNAAQHTPSQTPITLSASLDSTPSPSPATQPTPASAQLPTAHYQLPTSLTPATTSDLLATRYPLLATSGRLTITISDHGPGIAPELREKLFQKFARPETARTGGLGLGLSIVRGFLTVQGAEITATENPNGGTRFTISFPYTPPPSL